MKKKSAKKVAKKLAKKKSSSSDSTSTSSSEIDAPFSNKKESGHKPIQPFSDSSDKAPIQAKITKQKIVKNKVVVTPKSSPKKTSNFWFSP